MGCVEGARACYRAAVGKVLILSHKDEECSSTPLMWAAQNRLAAVVNLLLDKDANVESKNNYGESCYGLHKMDKKQREIEAFGEDRRG